MKKKRKKSSKVDLKKDWTQHQIISELCKMFSSDSKYQFPGYTKEDIYQECYIFGLVAAKKFVPDGPATLFTYLYRCIWNSLYNLKRNKYTRTGSCTEVSQKVHMAGEIDEESIIGDEAFSDHISLVQDIDDRIPFELRNDWKRMREFCTVNKKRREQVLVIIKDLIEEKVNG